MANSIDITGERFGFLTAIKFSHYAHYKSGQKHRVWLFKCDCGNESLITIGQARSGKTVSCGCMMKHLVSKARTIHGYASHRKKGKFNRTYLAWRNMKSRCFNKKNDRYNSYGGRGITVCDKWINFSGFLEDMGELPEGMSLERIDIDGNYCKENCIWIPLADQMKNMQHTLRVTYKDRTMSLSDLSKELGIAYSCLRERYIRGKTGDELFRPSMKNKSQRRYHPDHQHTLPPVCEQS